MNVLFIRNSHDSKVRVLTEVLRCHLLEARVSPFGGRFQFRRIIKNW